MRIFQDTFETRKRSFINAFSIGMIVPLKSIICFFSKKTSALGGLTLLWIQPIAVFTHTMRQTRM